MNKPNEQRAKLTEDANEVLANYVSFLDYEPEELDEENAKMLLKNAIDIISRLVKYINK